MVGERFKPLPLAPSFPASLSGKEDIAQLTGWITGKCNWISPSCFVWPGRKPSRVSLGSGLISSLLRHVGSPTIGSDVCSGSAQSKGGRCSERAWTPKEGAHPHRLVAGATAAWHFVSAVSHTPRTCWLSVTAPLSLPASSSVGLRSLLPAPHFSWLLQLLLPGMSAL